MNLGSGTRDRLKLSSLMAAGLGALAVAWVLALIFSIPLTTGPIDHDAAERILEGKLGTGGIERAQDYRSGQRWIAIAAAVLELAVLAGLAFWRPSPLRRVIAFLGHRPVAGAAAAGAGIAVLLALVGLPLDLVAVGRSRDFGLFTQPVSGWLTDFATSTGITAVLAAVGAAAAMWLWRWLKGGFWLAGSALVMAYAVIFVWLWPVVVSPLFNSFVPLPEGTARAEVLQLADEAGVDVGQVYEVDASRRSSTLNAYVNGIGSTKRVVIYDNALQDLSRPELSSLIAHELAHVKSRDLERGLLFAVLV
ncbi:MAG: M48 family metalloprotease, partial [Actinomycetota bacterium]|nr:M48 family metalloprotease [Actinomycetota bacterium]